MACLLEVLAAKPGNVHRGSDFDDATFGDFVLAGQAISSVMERAPHERLGQTILYAVQATRAVTATNVNLGIILLLAPLAMIERDEEWRAGLPHVLEHLTSEDACDVYDAINLAQPGGMGKVSEADLSAAPPSDLLTAMRLAAERDTIARQYTNNYHEIATIVLPMLLENLRKLPILSAIVRTHVEVLAALPDTLIARKCGPLIAEQASEWAGEVLTAGERSSEEYYHALADLDFWLRADGRKRNPGTTADLICAALFLALRDGHLQPPFVFE
jgi:triphosphoribosyl-dephospho-CoA synthase